MASTLEDLYDDYGLVDLAAVAKATGEPLQRLAKMTPVTASALRQNPKSPRAQESARRFLRVFGAATRSLGSRKAALIWMREPHPELEGLSPFVAMERGYFGAVEGLLEDLSSGATG